MPPRPVSRFHWELAAACLILVGALPMPSGAQDWNTAVQAELVKERVLGLLNLPDVVTEECVPTAAIVLQREAQWFRIALQQGSSWIERVNSDDFLPYPDFLKDRLTYLRAGWNGQMWKTPGKSDAVPLPTEWRRHLTGDVPIEFLDSQTIGDQTWILVRLDPSDRCGEKLEGADPVTGWILAHRPSGAPSAWFYSRGC